jgi:hypothetical protein
MQNNTPQISEVKNRRENFTVAIRRSDNDAYFSNQRKRMTTREGLANTGEQRADRQIDQEIQSQFSDSQQKLAASVTVKDFNSIYLIVKSVREAISSESDPHFVPFSEFFASNLPFTICEALKLGISMSNHQVIHEAVWVLSNAFAGSSVNIDSLIRLGVFSLFAEILQNTGENVTENILWSFANVLGEDTSYREEMSNYNIWGTLFESIERFRMNTKIARVSSWLFSNAMRGPPYPQKQLVA